MKRHKSIINLSRDHHHGLILAELIKKNSPKYKNLPDSLEGKLVYTLNAYEKDLLPHFNKEEEILFPLIKGRNENLDNIINLLLAEHRKISDLILSLEKNNNLEKILDDLGNLLTQHIRKEERDLFEKVEDFLTDEELEKLESFIELSIETL